MSPAAACQGLRQRRHHLSGGEPFSDVANGRSHCRRLHGEFRRVLERPVGRAANEVEQRLLALDVEVDGPFGDAERLGDILHPRLPESLVDEDRGRDLDEAREAVFWDRAGHVP